VSARSFVQTGARDFPTLAIRRQFCHNPTDV
jgi:hypothetical protein